MRSKTKKKIRKNSIKKQYRGGEIYKFKDSKFRQNERYYYVDIDDINDYNLESFKDKIIQVLEDRYGLEYNIENFIIINEKGKKINDLSELTSLFYINGNRVDPRYSSSKLREQAQAWISGNCSQPSYPGNYKTSINLDEVIDKINEYIIMDNIYSIVFFIGSETISKDFGPPCFIIKAYFTDFPSPIIKKWYGEFPLNIHLGSMHNEDSDKLNRFLIKLDELVSVKGTQIKWKVINNICCTCFPIFEYLTTKLKFEYIRNEGQGCGWCKEKCETFARTCIRP
jgi:hypothetical protein